MKVRQSFVANSSSSSFIVVYKNIDFDRLLETGVFPEGLEGKLVAYTNYYVSEAEDKVILTQDILTYLHENYEAQRHFRWTPFVEVVDAIYEGSDSYVIKPEHVGCSVMNAQVDYCATQDDLSTFIERYDK